MESLDVKKPVATKKSNAKSLRVKPETKKRFYAELNKINKKDFGRKVRPDQLLTLLLTLLEPKHAQKLQDESLTNSDKIEMKYLEHVKRFGPISKDEYLGLLLGNDDSKPELKNGKVFEGKSAS